MNMIHSISCTPVRISACFTWTDNLMSPMLSHPGPPKTNVLNALVVLGVTYLRGQVRLGFTAVTSKKSHFMQVRR